MSPLDFVRQTYIEKVIVAVAACRFYYTDIRTATNLPIKASRRGLRPHHPRFCHHRKSKRDSGCRLLGVEPQRYIRIATADGRRCRQNEFFKNAGAVQAQAGSGGLHRSRVVPRATSKGEGRQRIGEVGGDGERCRQRAGSGECGDCTVIIFLSVNAS